LYFNSRGKEILFILRTATKIFNFLPSELSHVLALKSLVVLTYLGFRVKADTSKKLTFINIPLRNKLGLAAGLDKNGDYIDALASLGFGFLEIGTVTPRPQPGNNKPRLFRIRSKQALVNNMGFNNKGVDYLVDRVKKRKSNIPIGVSIGKNFDTPIESALDDYLTCLNSVYGIADYIAINISSPNTKNLRDLQSKEFIHQLLSSIKDRQLVLAAKEGYKPVLIKISPDMDKTELKLLSDSVILNELDGIICTNTTTSHDYHYGKGGLSGKPLFKASTLTLKTLRSFVGNSFPIIASGGVMDLDAFEEKIDNGADLVQIYTGFIFKGPSIVDEIINVKTQ
jgi:dihydroorotate dehydrogenase